MPKIGWSGDRLAVAASGLTASGMIPRHAQPPIQGDRWTRNGLNPDAVMLNQLSAAVNAAVMHRSKEIFRATGILADPTLYIPPSISTPSGIRWYFAFRTGPFTHALFARAMLIGSGTGGTSETLLRIYSDTTLSTQVAEVVFSYGNSTLRDGYDYLKAQDKYVEGLSPDTLYYGQVRTQLGGSPPVGPGIVQSICIGDLPSMTEQNNGYLDQNLTSETPVLDVFRENIAKAIKSTWRRGASSVLHWTLDDDPWLQIASATPTNVVDTTSTTISAATPGYTLNMTGKARLSQTSGVPCRMSVFGGMTTAITGGSVYLKNSAGTTIASIVNGWSTTTRTWVSTTFNMPVGTDKYDLQFATSAGTFELRAISIWEEDP